MSIRDEGKKAMFKRRSLTALAALAVLGIGTQAAFAHHGWSWTSDENFELTGKITEAKLGNPHGRLILAANDAEWIVEVGQPWRNSRAGLTDAMLAPGVELTALGQRSADPAERRMKAERVRIEGTLYDLYPDRD